MNLRSALCRPWLTLVLLAFACTVTAQSLPDPAATPQQPARLGVAVEAVPFAELERRGLSHGVVVRDTMEAGPADEAGVRPGDIIVALNGQAAYSPERLQWLVGRAQAPGQIELRLWRDGESHTVTVDATRAVSRPGGEPAEGAVDRVAQQAYLGIRMQPLTADLRQAFGVGPDRGVLIAEVVDDGPAAAAGVQAGDVLVGMAGKTVRGPADVHRAMAYFDPGERIELGLVRDGAEQSLEVELGGVSPSRFHGRYPPQAPFQTWRDWSHPWMEPWQRAPLPPTMQDEFDDRRPRHWPPNW